MSSSEPCQISNGNLQDLSVDPTLSEYACRNLLLFNYNWRLQGQGRTGRGTSSRPSLALGRLASINESQEINGPENHGGECLWSISRILGDVAAFRELEGTISNLHFHKNKLGIEDYPRWREVTRAAKEIFRNNQNSARLRFMQIGR